MWILKAFFGQIRPIMNTLTRSRFLFRLLFLKQAGVLATEAHDHVPILAIVLSLLKLCCPRLCPLQGNSLHSICRDTKAWNSCFYYRHLFWTLNRTHWGCCNCITVQLISLSRPSDFIPSEVLFLMYSSKISLTCKSLNFSVCFLRALICESPEVIMRSRLWNELLELDNSPPR